MPDSVLPPSTNWTPQGIGNSNWNPNDAYESVGNELLSDSKSLVLLSDNASQALLP